MALPALLMNQKHKLMAEQIFTQPRQHFSIRSGRIQLDFYRPRLPLCPTELDVVSVNWSLCEIMQRARAAINLFCESQFQ